VIAREAVIENIESSPEILAPMTEIAAISGKNTVFPTQCEATSINCGIPSMKDDINSVERTTPSIESTILPAKKIIL
jgi:hypothetical protein